RLASEIGLLLIEDQKLDRDRHVHDLEAARTRTTEYTLHNNQTCWSIPPGRAGSGAPAHPHGEDNPVAQQNRSTEHRTTELPTPMRAACRAGRAWRSTKKKRTPLGVSSTLRTPQRTPRCGQAARPISTGQLHTLPCFHFRPINPVICWGPYSVHTDGRPHLGAGFPLRCFQRLSDPNVANQPCPWQDNWHTRGSSVPVLSY